MGDLLIRNINPRLKRELQKRARAHGTSLSAEAQTLIQRGLAVPEPPKKMGTWMRSLVRPEDRGGDLVFEYPGELPNPPDLK